MPNFFRLFDVHYRSRPRHANKNPGQEENGRESQGTGEDRETNEQTKTHPDCGPGKTYQHDRLSPGCQTERNGERTRRPGTPAPSPPSDVDAEAPGNSQRD